MKLYIFTDLKDEFYFDHVEHDHQVSYLYYRFHNDIVVFFLYLLHALARACLPLSDLK